MAEQTIAVGPFSDVSQAVLLQAVRELGVHPSNANLIKSQTLMDTVNEIELRKLKESPCPKGDQHDIRLRQFGPDDGNGCNDPVYYQCNNCGDSYSMRYLG